jgi:hypothetical protein
VSVSVKLKGLLGGGAVSLPTIEILGQGIQPLVSSARMIEKLKEVNH